MPDRLLIRTQVEGSAEASEQLNRLAAGVKSVGDDAEVSSAKVDRSMGVIRGGLKSAAGMVGLFGAAWGAKDTLQAGMDLQTQQAALRQSLLQTGQAGKGAYAEIMAASEGLSEHGGFSTEENLQAMNQFEHETHSTGVSMKALSAATEIARARHESFSTAVNTVTSTLGGNYRAVRQLVHGFVPLTSNVDALDRQLHVNVAAWEAHAAAMNKASEGSGTAWLRQLEISHGVTGQMRAQAESQDRLATGQKALGLITDQYSGQFQRYADTAQGRAEAAANAFHNLDASIGEGLLPEVKVAAGVMASFAGLLDRNRWAAYGLVGVVTLLGADAFGKKLVAGVRDGAGAVRAFGGAAKAAIGWVAGLGAAQEGEATASEEAAGQMSLLDAATGEMAAGSAVAVAETDALTGQMVLFDTAVTEGAAATTAFDVALGVLVSPVLLVIAAVAALSVGIYELVEHFGAVQKAATVAWHVIEHGAEWAWHGVERVGNETARSFAGIWRGIERGATDAARWIAHAFTDAGHLISRDTPLGALGDVVSGNFGGAVHSATFGLLNQGGEVRAHGDTATRVKHLYTGGPAGTDTVEGWLTPGEEVLTRAGAATLNGMIGQGGITSLNAGGNPLQPSLAGLEGMQIAASPVVLKLNERVLAEGVVRYTLRRAARGPSSLTGGSLVTGV